MAIRRGRCGNGVTKEGNVAADQATKVLVTGHNGYIGAVLVERLLAKGYEVRGLDSGYFQECIFSTLVEPTEVITKDMRDVEAKDLFGVDAIIHLAGLSNDPMGELNASLTMAINHEASVRLAELAKSLGIQRFLFSSSCSMYGSSDGETTTEESPLNPLTAYARSKVKTEEALFAMAGAGFSPTYLRNSTVYGVSPKLRFDLVVNNLVGWAMTTGEIKMMSDGTPWRPLAHVEDISDAFIAILEAPIDAVHNEAFNIGQDSENYQMRDIADAVSMVVPDAKITYAAGASPDARSYQVDFSKVRRAVPAFQPQWTVELGAQQLYEAISQRGINFEDFQGRRFVRLEQLKYLMSKKTVDAQLQWEEPFQPQTLRKAA